MITSRFMHISGHLCGNTFICVCVTVRASISVLLCVNVCMTVHMG